MMAKAIADVTKSSSALTERARLKSNDQASRETTLNWALSYGCRDTIAMLLDLIFDTSDYRSLCGLVSARISLAARFMPASPLAARFMHASPLASCSPRRSLHVRLAA